MKKVFVVLALCLSFLMPNFSFANTINANNSKPADFEITTPKEESTFINNNTIVVTGIGKEKDKVEISVYSVKRNTLNEKEIMSKKLEKKYTLTVDNLKVFAQDVELTLGENNLLIVLTRGNKNYYFTNTVNYSNDVEKEFSKIIRQIDIRDSIN